MRLSALALTSSRLLSLGCRTVSPPGARAGARDGARDGAGSGAPTALSFDKPKVELHIHLDGAIRPKTILEVAKRRKIKLPTKNDNQFLKLITCDGPTTLTEMLTKFGYFMPIVAGDRDAIRQIAYELVEDKANEKIVYFEARYSPHLLANCDVYPIPWKQSEGDLSPDEVVRLVNEGFEKGQRNFGIKVRSILSCLRHMEAWSPEVVELCKKYRKDGVVGLDLAGDESINYEPSRGHVQTYQEAVRCGIHRTVHAGEVGPPEVVREAVEILKAERIGHGYSIIKDAKLYQEILQKDIHLEACLYSSYITGACKADFSKHPVVRFMNDGANFSLSTDDPLIFNSTIHTEYNMAAKDMNFTEMQFMRMNLNAARSSFLCENKKKELLNQLRKAYGMPEEPKLDTNLNNYPCL
ncbi:adenosine deaminase isoform X2 [Callorhinchus milii]|uniref:adenosine deaminase isoform X2 n=1 Tax=Callorhinchus milii TaxID=7868 RepID=UPI001C3FD0B0|nr:adenosine deaminase isoform X2 [Callorhinchus milii]